MHFSVFFSDFTMIINANQNWTLLRYIRTNHHALKSFSLHDFFNRTLSKIENFLVSSVKCATIHDGMRTKFKTLNAFWKRNWIRAPFVCQSSLTCLKFFAPLFVLLWNLWKTIELGENEVSRFVIWHEVHNGFPDLSISGFIDVEFGSID